MHRVISYIFIVKQHIAAIRFDQSHRHVKGCGLARSIGTEQTDNIATSDIQADRIYDLPSAIFFYQILKIQCCHFYDLMPAR
jgi:hypothetical protein